MIPYEIAPKRSALMKATIRDEKPRFVFQIPADDTELAGVVGYKADGTPKLTYLELGQAAVATAIQVQLSKRLAAGAARVGPESDAEFVPEQYKSDAEIAALIDDSYADAYRLLVGERAESAGRLSEKAKYEARMVEDRERQARTFRDNFAATTSKGMRQMIVQMAEQFGLSEVAAELSAQL